MPTTLTIFEQGAPFQFPFEGKTLEEFKVFLQSMWHNKRWRIPFEKANTPLSPFFRWNGDWASPQGYVGFIKYQDCVVTLYPKLFAHQPPSQQLMWKHLFFYLDYAQPSQYAWDFVQGTAEGLNNAWELYQMMCLAKIKSYLTEEVYQSYEPTTALLPQLKGRLAVQVYLQQALSKGKWQQLAVRHAPLILDNPLNQLLKFVLIQWQNNAQKDTTPDLVLAELLQHLENITLRHFTLEEALTIRLPSFEGAAKQVLEICIYFLENKVANIGTAQHQNFVWLLPMERVYERFIFGFLKKHFPQLKIEWQNSAYLATSCFTQLPALRIQPDMYLPEFSKVLDAKYKLPSAHTSLGILPEDAYQMIAYCLAKQAKEACLMYPTGFSEETTAPHSFQIKTGNTQDNCILLKAFALQLTSAQENHTWQTTLTQQLIKQFEAILY